MRAEGEFEQLSLKAPIHEQWTLSANSLIGSTSDGKQWTLYKIPLPGRAISDAYFKLSELEVIEKRLYLQGYFVPHGKDFATWNSIDYSLSLIPENAIGPRTSIRLANGDRPNARELTGERWRDQSKAYFATFGYGGIDLTSVVPGQYELWISGRAGDDVFCRPLRRTLNVSNNSDQNQALLPEVSIIGSCVTRDNFNSSISPYWKSLWRLNDTFYQSSIVSLMSDTVDVPESFVDGLNKHDREVVSRDFSKSFLNELAQTPPDILILDLFADTRFGVIEVGGSWATNNEWKLPNAVGYESLKDNRRVSGSVNEDEFIILFTEGCVKLKEFIAENIPNTRICLNSARNTYIHRGVNTEGGKFSRGEIIRLNKLWDILDDKFVSTFNPVVLDSMPLGIQADSYHQWGPGPVHYEERYYSNFHASLRKQLGMDACFELGH
ncbi:MULTISPECIES: DUF6270 domain-containing protein [Brevibacterium]|uniref:Uncharacterized protein n=1 Tax=Brevibacterium antiquum CNRZ 918 TaxID=1255637 RepID=A0A2H1II81_9MICO|nr:MULTISPECIES: DUF6270 domain-containing protein [Brevibacterium]SMX74682.1 hypothetical protein BANT918_01008 [Brevibacterium antiquum CNRZ 918]